MSRKFSIAYFAHSLRSDWNNGNAHFLRGLLRSLGRLQHSVVAFEAESDWSIDHLREEEAGADSLARFAQVYGDLRIETFDRSKVGAIDLWRVALSEIEIVIVHEWNPPSLVHALLALRKELGFKLLFHDTHHRASSSSEDMRALRVDEFDGVLVFGEVLRSIYRRQFGMEAVWTVHEAADTSVFQPDPRVEKTNDVVWIGNWGDGERAVEIQQFLLGPAAAMRDRRVSIYGVRYPEAGLRALRDAGVCYRGYVANLDAPSVYASARVTVHIPRAQYASVMSGIPTIRVFEALACGIPLISAPWQDTESLFEAGDYLTVRNEAEAREAIEFLLGDAEAAMAQAKRGLATVLARHSCDERARQLTAILEEHFS